MSLEDLRRMWPGSGTLRERARREVGTAAPDEPDAAEWLPVREPPPPPRRHTPDPDDLDPNGPPVR